MNIKHKLVAGFSIMILVTALATGLGWWISRQAADKTTAISKVDIPLLKKINQIFANLKEARLEEKRFFLDKDLTAYDSGLGFVS